MKQEISGIFRSNEKNFGFVAYKAEDSKEEEEIFIPAKYVNSALDQDEVLVEVYKSKNGIKKAEGKIVKIIKRQKEELVGIFQKNGSFGFVVPDDKKIGTDIFIPKREIGKAKNEDKVVVKITKYPNSKEKKKAEGKIIEILGNVDASKVDILSIVKELKLPNEFPSFVLDEANKVPSVIDEKDIGNRRDLRGKKTFTIDGQDAKDLDDAVMVTKDQEGQYILDVHIADVSHYVKEDSILDKEAIFRGTSVYMLDRVIPMLPTNLSNGICSLNANVDRFALSCTMKINDQGIVIDTDIYKSVIKVTKRMSYDEVYKLINNLDEDIVKQNEKYIADFKLMEELAKILKNRRIDEGYLDLNIAESKIVLDKNGKAVDIKKYDNTFANQIIEQFMLTANESVAEKFYWLEAPFIYRVHEEPEYEKVKETNKFLKSLRVAIKAKNENVKTKAFAEVLDEVRDTENEKIVSNMLLRTLKVAKYEETNSGHFGIASKYYCHFTSPIRRYPDLFIHRVISKYLDANYKLNEKQFEKYETNAKDYAFKSSEAEKNATKAERLSIDVKKAEYMESKIGNKYEGTISSVTSFGMFVELENTVEGLVRFENINEEEYFIFNDEKRMLIGEHTGKTYKIGDKVKIRVIKASKQLRQIDFELVKQGEKSDVRKSKNRSKGKRKTKNKVIKTK